MTRGPHHYRKAGGLILVGLLLAVSWPAQADELLTDDDRLPTARRSVAAAIQGDDVYIFGGRDGNTWITEGLRYDLGSDVIFTSTADLPGPRYYHRAAALPSGIYILGGWGPYDTREQIVHYDPIANTMTILPERLLPGRFATSVLSIGDSIYVFGGETDLDVYTDEILRYTPGSGIQTMNAKLPTPRSHHSAVYDGRYAWIFGGDTATGRTDEIVRYDPVTDVAKAVAVLPSARSWSSAIWDGHRAFVFGGLGDYDQIVRFDPANETSTVMASELDESYFTAAVFDGDKTRIIGGGLGASTLTDEILEYDTTPQAPRNILAFPRTPLGSVDITWQASPDNTYAWLSGYNVYRRDNVIGSWDLVATVDPDTTRYTDRGLFAGVYEYRVTAVSAGVDESVPSATFRTVVVGT